MARYTLALCAAAVLVYENGQGGRLGDDWSLHTGDLGELGDAYEVYQKMNGIANSRKHPLERNASVRSSIASSADGQEMFEHVGYLNYPGISNAWGRVFSLREEWRDILERRGSDELSAREEKVLECVNFLEERYKEAAR